MVQKIQKELHEEHEKNKEWNVIEATHTWKKSADTTCRKPKKKCCIQWWIKEEALVNRWKKRILSTASGT